MGHSRYNQIINLIIMYSTLVLPLVAGNRYYLIILSLVGVLVVVLLFILSCDN